MAKVLTITIDNFQTELMKEAESRPVVLTFASSQMPECGSFNESLEALSSELDFTLGKVSLDEPDNMAFVQMFRLQALPFAVVLFKGEVQDAVQESMSKEDLKKRLSRHFVSEEERLRMALEENIAAGKYAEVKPAIEAEIAQKPEDDHLRVMLAKCELGLGNPEKATELLSAISPNSQEYTDAKSLLDLMELLVEAAKNNPVEGDDLRFREACQMAEKKDYRSALEVFFQLVVSNPDFKDGAAKKAMVILFNVLGAKNPLAWEFRAKLNSVLFI